MSTLADRIIEDDHTLSWLTAEYLTTPFTSGPNEGITPLEAMGGDSYRLRCRHLNKIPLTSIADLWKMGKVPEWFTWSKVAEAIRPLAERGEIKDWLKPDRWGLTPLHYAAEGAFLDLVPKEVLTPENLLLKSLVGLGMYSSTPLNFAIRSRKALKQIPIDVLTKLKEIGKLEDISFTELGVPVPKRLSKQIVKHLISNTPYDPFDL